MRRLAASLIMEAAALVRSGSHAQTGWAFAHLQPKERTKGAGEKNAFNGREGDKPLSKGRPLPNPAQRPLCLHSTQMLLSQTALSATV